MCAFTFSFSLKVSSKRRSKFLCLLSRALLNLSPLTLITVLNSPVSMTTSTSNGIVVVTYYCSGFFWKYISGGGGGQTNILRNRGGHRLQLKCIKFKLAKAQGGQDHFQGAKCPPPPPLPSNPLSIVQCTVLAAHQQ